MSSGAYECFHYGQSINCGAEIEYAIKDGDDE